MTDQAIALLAPRIGTRAACAASGVAQATWYRRHRARPTPPRRPPVPHRDRLQPRALSLAERAAILAALHAERFADTAPAEVWATLLDEGTYLGSLSTFYRLLRQAGETRERRAQATHPPAVKPELVATGPNRVWSWDITKLHGPAKWTYYYLYVIPGIYSRYAVGWMVATRESAALAEKLIAATVAKQGIGRGQLTIHADRGSSMTSKPVTFLLADLGVIQSTRGPMSVTTTPTQRRSSRPSNTGPRSLPASARSRLPERTARRFSPGTTPSTGTPAWALHTAADVHHGTAAAVRAHRARVLAAAYRQHPERFVSRPPTPPELPATSWINPPQKEAATQ